MGTPGSRLAHRGGRPRLLGMKIAGSAGIFARCRCGHLARHCRRASCQCSPCHHSCLLHRYKCPPPLQSSPRSRRRGTRWLLVLASCATPPTRRRSGGFSATTPPPRRTMLSCSSTRSTSKQSVRRRQLPLPPPPPPLGWRPRVLLPHRPRRLHRPAVLRRRPRPPPRAYRGLSTARVLTSTAYLQTRTLRLCA